MRKVTLLLSLALILSSCSTEKTASPQNFYSPSECASLKVLSTIQQALPQAQYVPTEWQPAEGTDLEAAYQAGGIACTYGIASAEIGATILWAPDKNGLWETRKKAWLAGEYQQGNFSQVDDSLILKEGITGADGAYRWSAQVLSKGFWISINASFVRDQKLGQSIIQGAVASLRSESEFETNSIVGCYVGSLAKDNYLIEINSQDNNKVRATIAYLNYQKDSSRGSFDGRYTNGILNGIYTFQSEGLESVRELFFKGDKAGFVAGYGPAEMRGDISYFTRPLSITWEKAFTFEPSQDCQTLLAN